MSNIHEDRQGIEAVLFRYAQLLDTKRYARLTEVFTPEATAHYVGMAECKGVENIIALVSGVLDRCGNTQHLLGNVWIDVKGDEATASCYLQAIHVGLGDYSDRLLTIWGEYLDRLVRTPAGWRISHRELTTLHSQGDIGLARG
jgi:3-phenylpropionate/cinnamic acid dioxygenase small subunit